MANPTMDRIDEGLMTMGLDDLAELYCRTLEKAKDADGDIARLFCRIMRRHIALTVLRKLEEEANDENQAV